MKLQADNASIKTSDKIIATKYVETRLAKWATTLENRPKKCPHNSFLIVNLELGRRTTNRQQNTMRLPISNSSLCPRD